MTNGAADGTGDAPGKGARRQYAVQKPTGGKWETLLLVDDPGQGREGYRQAVRAHGRTYVRLVRVDFHSDDALSDYDWRVIELHDPRKGGAPPPADPRPTRPVPRQTGTRPHTRRPGEKVPVPLWIWLMAALTGVLAAVLWAQFT